MDHAALGSFVPAFYMSLIPLCYFPCMKQIFASHSRQFRPQYSAELVASGGFPLRARIIGSFRHGRIPRAPACGRTQYICRAERISTQTRCAARCAAYLHGEEPVDRGVSEVRLCLSDDILNLLGLQPEAPEQLPLRQVLVSGCIR